MKLRSYSAAALLLGVGIMYGCSGGSMNTSTSGVTAVSGKVADGYLANAQVFLDKNGNYQLDTGEPSTTTDSTGSFTLTIDAADAGKYPVVVVAIAGQTIDLDTGSAVQNSYVLSMHAVAVTGSTSTSTSGTVTNFISPVSTLVRETLEANPGMTLADAMAKVRNQLDLPGDMNLLGDYVFGSYSGSHKAGFQHMHDTATRMAGLMGAQAGTVMNGKTPDLGRYRSMMGQIGQNLQQIAYDVRQGDTADLQDLSNQIGSTVGTVPPGMFRNYSTLFRNMTSNRTFWNMSGGMKKPKRHRMM